MYFLIKGRVLISTAIVILFSRYIDGVRKEKERLTAACAGFIITGRRSVVVRKKNINNKISNFKNEK